MSLQRNEALLETVLRTPLFNEIVSSRVLQHQFLHQFKTFLQKLFINPTRAQQLWFDSHPTHLIKNFIKHLEVVHSEGKFKSKSHQGWSLRKNTFFYKPCVCVFLNFSFCACRRWSKPLAAGRYMDKQTDMHIEAQAQRISSYLKKKNHKEIICTNKSAQRLHSYSRMQYILRSNLIL